MQAAGTHVPDAPAFTPVTLKSTSTPARGPLSEWTFAVTVWLVPAGLVASSGVMEMPCELTTMFAPAIRMYASPQANAFPLLGSLPQVG